MKDYFSILGVEPTASEDEIKSYSTNKIILINTKHKESKNFFFFHKNQN